MLVLKRKAREVVVVGGPDTLQPLVTITVLEIAGGSVRLGFQADGVFPVHRLEVWQRIHGNDSLDLPVPSPVPTDSV